MKFTNMKLVLKSLIVLGILCVLAISFSSAQQSAPTHPQSSASAIQSALAFEKQGKFPEAESAWKRVVKIQPRNGQAYAHLGLLEARQEHYPEAVGYYKKAEVLDPKIPQLSLNLGLAYFKSGDFTNAGKIFQAELKKHPEQSTPEAQRLTMLVAMSDYGAHDYKSAIPYLKQAAAVDQRNLPLRLALAHCYLWTKQLDLTMDVYREILNIDPNSAEADMIAGEALDEKGDNAGAVEQFRAAAQANPKEPNVHFGLAYLYWTQKRYAEAIAEFKAELANDPKNNQAMIYLGDTYVQQSDMQNAKEVLERANAFATTDPLIHLDLGIVEMETGNNELAERELLKTISLEPDNVTAHFRLAKIYKSEGKNDEAKKEFVSASTLNKQHAASLHDRIAAANAKPNTAPSPAPNPVQQPDQPAKPE